MGVTPGPEADRAFVGGFGVLHAKGDGTDAGAVLARKTLGKGVGLGVDDEVDAALAVQRHVLVAVFGNRLEAHAFEQGAHGGGIRRGVFNELEAVRAHGVVPSSRGGRR